MIDIVSLPKDGTTDIGLLNTQVPKATNVLSVQLRSLYYALGIGVDLEYFLDPEFTFQNESFKSYLVQVLANNSINVTSVLDTAESLYQDYVFNLAQPESEDSLISR